MGTIYHGVYAEQVGYDAHEGYVARILPDGTETATWTYETRAMTGFRALCECGWRSATVHPATTADDDEAERAAAEDWDRDHLRPLVRAVAERYTVRGDQLVDLAASLRAGLTTTVGPDGVERFTEHALGVLHAVEALDSLLDLLAEPTSATA